MGNGDIAAPANGGLKSVQDLYDLINGKTTSTSGGNVTTSGGDQTTSGNTSVVKTDQGISQDSMNAMLQQILSGTNGLASVAGGQRSAGGYSSTTNQMLVNDLLTRSASQVAQQNQSKTVTSVSGPVTVSNAPKTVATGPTQSTVGGATIAGVGNVAGSLAALQALSSGLNSASSIGSNNIFKKASSSFMSALGFGTDSPTSNSDVNPIAPAAGNINSLPSSVADYQASQQASQPTTETAPNQITVDAPIAGVDTSNIVSTPAPAPAPVEVQAPVVETPAPASPDTSYDSDVQEFADGGYVTGNGKPWVSQGRAMNPILKLADGGQVTKKLSNLSTNQFAKVIDPKTGLIGEGTGVNQEDVAQGNGVANGNPILANVPTPAVDPVTGDSVSGRGVNGGGGNTSSASGQGSQNSGVNGTIGDAGKLAGAFGALTNNRDLGIAGKIAGIASADTPGQAALGVAGLVNPNIGKIASIASVAVNPNVQNVTDLAMALANPTAAAVNSIANVVGLPTIGEIASNIANMVSPNQAMTPDQQASAQMASDNPVSTSLAGLANQSSDPMGALMGATNAFGTAPASTTDAPAASNDPGPAPSAPASAPSTSAGSGVGGNGNNGMGPNGNNNGMGANSTNGARGAIGNTGGDPGGSSPGSSGGPGDADGGEISGQGGPIGDKIHTMLSDGEYVLSADTVKAIGVAKLDALQEKYHTPAAVQKLKGYARG
jgi:hypothetical protein